jgi:hypothetical protein
MTWFSKTSTFNYTDLREDVQTIVHIKIDKSMEYLYQSSNSQSYSFQFTVENSILLTRDSYVKNIPKQVYFDSVERILQNKPFIIYPNGDDYHFTVCVVQNPISIIPRPIGTRLACAAIYQAKDANEICAITLEPLRSLTAFAVSQCGHVFDQSAAALSMCPLCKASVAWTICSPTPAPVSIL